MTAATPAPVRLLAPYDNVLLAHADRSRVVPEQYRVRLKSKNAVVPGTATVTRTGSPSLDLAGGVARQLAEAGVRMVDRDNRCTVERPELLRALRRAAQNGARIASITLSDSHCMSW